MLSKMRVLVNAVSIKEGGPRVVLVKLLRHMAAHCPDIEWYVAAPQQLSADLDRAPKTTHLAVDVDRSFIRLLKWYEFDLSAAARRWRADVVFSVTNYLPFRRMPWPTLLLEQHAGHFSAEFDRLTQQAASSAVERWLWWGKSGWVRNSVRSATVLTVQSTALAHAICGATGRRERVHVIPHGPGWVDPAAAPAPRHRDERWRIGYVTKWGVQKDFVTLFKAIEKLARDGFPVTLVLTLDPTYRPASEMLTQARAMGLDALIENHGEVPGSAISALYDGLDIFVFPSLCESFGMPMVEAMARGLPIVVADTPVNREITGEAGLTFSPEDSDSLAGVLAGLIDSAERRETHASRSLARGREFSWDKAADGTLRALDAAARAQRW